MTELILLDLDNTLIKGQSQQLFLQYLFSKKIIKIFPFLKISLWFALYKISVVKNPKPIMNYAFKFLKDWQVSDFQKLVDSFFKEKLKSVFYKEALNIINEHQMKNRELVIISNAILPIVEKISLYLGIKRQIGTELEIENGKFTGKIKGEIIYGKNKAKILKQYVQNNNLSLKESWSYADHFSDMSILKMTTHPFAVNPNKLLYKEATKRNWPILYFKHFNL